MKWTEAMLRKRYQIWKRTIWTPAMIDDLQQMLSRGLKHKEIAKLLGLKTKQIDSAVKRLKKDLAPKVAQGQKTNKKQGYHNRTEEKCQWFV